MCWTTNSLTGTESSGWKSLDCGGDGGDVIRSGAAAASDDVHGALQSHFPDSRGCNLRSLIVCPHRVRKAGIGVAAHGSLDES